MNLKLLKEMRDDYFRKGDALDEVIKYIELNEMTSKNKKTIKTDSGLSFSVSSRTVPGVEPIKKEIPCSNDFDIQNKGTGIIDWGNYGLSNKNS